MPQPIRISTNDSMIRGHLEESDMIKYPQFEEAPGLRVGQRWRIRRVNQSENFWCQRSSVDIKATNDREVLAVTRSG